MVSRFQVVALSGTLFLHGCASPINEPIERPSTATNQTTVTPSSNVPINRFKHKVAIARLTLPANASNSELLTHATEDAKTLLENNLRQSGKFMLLEHGLLHMAFENDNLRVVNDETVGADYLVTGKLMRHELVTPGLLDGWRGSKVAHAYSSVQLDIIDGHTGTIVFTRQFDGEASTDMPASSALPLPQQLTLQTQALTRAITSAAPEISQTLQQRRWRGQILSAQQGFILVNSGAGQGIQVGDRFHVLPLEQAQMEPPTAKVPALASPGSSTSPAGPTPFLATLKVVAQAGENENELSVCELVDGRLPETLGDLSVLDAP